MLLSQNYYKTLYEIEHRLSIAKTSEQKSILLAIAKRWLLHSDYIKLIKSIKK